MKATLAATATLAHLATAAAADVTLINVFEVPREDAAEVVSAWEAARDVMAAQPGYISTALHAALDDGARFQLINIAKWESAAAFKAASEALRTSGAFRPKEGWVVTPGLYQVLRAD